ncbi:hypothetical protein [Burkholderia metallica]|nr:hypothetical protein [Burkholderia metallica]
MTTHHENRPGPADMGPLGAMSRFRATYDGPALESSEMDVRELAPALLAIGDLLDASTRALCGNQVRPQVNVRGSFKTGSFGIDFTLATSLPGRMRDMLSGHEGTALANAVTILDEHRKMAFSIVSLACKDDNKWRLYDGTSTIHAAITDAGFLSRVNNSQISFSKGDVLLCNVRMQQWQTSDGAKTEYEVTDVLEHRPAGLQIPLPGL